MTSASAIYNNTDLISPKEGSVENKFHIARTCALRLQDDSRITEADKRQLRDMTNFAQPIYGGRLVAGLVNVHAPAVPDLPNLPLDPFNDGLEVKVRHA